MKIERTSTELIAIKDVEIGQCFVHDNRLHLKVDKGPMEFVDDDYEDIVIDLERNRLNAFGGLARVQLVNAKIVVDA